MKGEHFYRSRERKCQDRLRGRVKGNQARAESEGNLVPEDLGNEVGREKSTEAGNYQDTLFLLETLNLLLGCFFQLYTVIIRHNFSRHFRF